MKWDGYPTLRFRPHSQLALRHSEDVGDLSEAKLGCRRKKKPRLAEARREPIFLAPCYLLASVGPRFHTDSDLPPEAGAGLLILS
jgi:hypothetical protein